MFGLKWKKQQIFTHICCLQKSFLCQRSICSLVRSQALSLSVSALVLHNLSVLYLPTKPGPGCNLCTEEFAGVHWAGNSSLKPCLARKSPLVPVQLWRCILIKAPEFGGRCIPTKHLCFYCFPEKPGVSDLLTSQAQTLCISPDRSISESKQVCADLFFPYCEDF